MIDKLTTEGCAYPPYMDAPGIEWTINILFEMLDHERGNEDSMKRGHGKALANALGLISELKQIIGVVARHVVERGL